MTTPYPTVRAGEIGWLREVDMIEIDRVMIEDFNIGLIQMMENAGRNLAQLVLDLWAPPTVTVLAGSGGNGGGGLVAARHLANRGVDVKVTLSKPADRFTGVPAHQLDILQRMGVAVVDTPQPAAVVIDALIGYSLKGAPQGRGAELIAAVGDLGASVVSLDTPSGLDVTTGLVPGVVVTADATITLALPKIGLREAAQVGDLYVADISVPPAAYDTIGVGPPPDFSSSPLLRVS